MAASIPLFRPTIRRRDMDHVLTCMVSDSVGPGAANRELCAAVAEYLGAAGAVAVASFYGALLAAFEALGLQPGDSVVIPALAPRVYRDVLARRGLLLHAADVEPASSTLSVESARQAVAAGAKAIVAHYSLGFVPAMDGLLELGVPVIEDLSQGLGACYRERRCGGFGTLTVISLSPDGIVTGGEGGIVAARDKQLARRLAEVPEVHLAPLADLNASLAIAQMREIERFVRVRREIAAAFAESVARTRHKPLSQDGEAENVHYSFPVMLASGMRDVRQYARKKGVETAPAFAASIAADGALEAGEGSGGRAGYPAARAAFLRCLLFPLYPSLGKARAETVAKVLATLP